MLAIAFFKISQTFAEIFAEGFSYIWGKIIIKFVCGYTAILSILLRLKNNSYQRHRCHNGGRWSNAAVTCVEALTQQLGKRNEDTVCCTDRILIQIMYVYDVVLDSLYKLLRHYKMVRVPFSVFTAEFTHLSGEAFSIQICVLSQHLKIGAFHNLLAHMFHFIQHLFLAGINPI
ncbi:hypothetical protein D3C81_1308520 [compost metagenome]